MLKLTIAFVRVMGVIRTGVSYVEDPSLASMIRVTLEFTRLRQQGYVITRA